MELIKFKKLNFSIALVAVDHFITSPSQSKTYWTVAATPRQPPHPGITKSAETQVA